MKSSVTIRSEEVEIRTSVGRISGNISVPQGAQQAVIFAHGSGSGRHSPRNSLVAESLQEAGIATLLIDLLTKEEGTVDQQTGEHRFNIELLAERLFIATEWLNRHHEKMFRLGYFGASTGAAAALVAASQRGDISAIVSRGGRPDLAGEALSQVDAATLLIVGGHDEDVLELNRQALAQLDKASNKQLQIVPGATHLFEEPGALDAVAQLASDWFIQYLGAGRPTDYGRTKQW